MTPAGILSEPPPNPEGEARLSASLEVAEMEAQAAIEIRRGYWAAKPGREVIAELRKKEEAFVAAAEARGFINMSRIQRAQYYGMDPAGMNSGIGDTQQIGFDGEDGEQVRFRIGETRSFAKQLFTMALAQRPAFQAIAANTDYDALAQVETGDQVVTYFYNAKYGEKKERAALERAGLFGLAWTVLAWDREAGKPMPPPADPMPATPAAPAPGGEQAADPAAAAPAIDPSTVINKQPAPVKPQRTGDMFIRVKPWWQCFHEPLVEDFDDHLWWGFRERRSRWELMKTFPDHVDALRKAQSSDSIAQRFSGLEEIDQNDDMLWVRHWFHVDCGSLESGRYLIYVNGVDDPLNEPAAPSDVDPTRAPWVPIQYNDGLPCVPMRPDDFIGTAFGYSNVWDMCSINQMLDQIVSDCASNISTFGRQTIVTEEGTEWNLQAIADGHRWLTKPANAKNPEALMYAAVPEASKWFLEYLESKFQSLSGLNSVVRGDPSKNISSGTMAALFHSIAIEFNSALQAAIDDHRERVANKILSMLKQFAEAPLVAEIAGIDERPYLQSFKRDSLLGLDKVVIKTANPMMRTQAGRTEIAQMLLQLKDAEGRSLIQTPEQLIEVLVSGQLKPLYKGPRGKLLRIAWENEELVRLGTTPVSPANTNAKPWVEEVVPPPLGLPPPPPGSPPKTIKYVPGVRAMVYDDPEKHINEHLTLLSSRQAAQNAQLVGTVLAHIDDHMRVWREMDPALAAMLKIPPPPQPAMLPNPGPANSNGGAPPQMAATGTDGAPAGGGGPPMPEAMKPKPGGGPGGNVPLPQPPQAPVQ